ncbi:MAG: type II toxin-antitoxin system VapB family antitoxin [Spirochaetes bacterium]|nr:type II toxin-antitoxin system VapB family antitoxin [Spirochaetota bacterium]
MKRANLVLDEKLLEKTVQASGKKTYSEAVNEAMRQYVQKKAFTQIFSLEGSGAWQGNLNRIRK